MMPSHIPGLQWRVPVPIENMGSGKLVGLLRVALGLLGQTMSVPKYSRVARALALLESINEQPELLITADPAFLERVIAAHRTGWEFFLVMYARSLRQPFATPFTKDKLTTFLDGPEVEIPGANTHPRNIQFELYIAAMLILGGAEVTPGEPDLRLLLGRERIGLAAKRVSSLKPRKLEHRVDEAVEQIRGSGIRGLVVLNLDSRFGDIDPQLNRPLLLDEFDRRFDELNDLAEKCARVPEVIGLMSHGYAARWDMPARGEERLPGLRKSSPMRWVAFGDSAEERDLFEGFANGWTSRLESRLERMMKGEYV